MKLKAKAKDKNAINRKSLIELYIGITPALDIVFGLILLIILVLITTGISFSYKVFIYFLLFLGIIYLSLILLTAILLYNLVKQTKLSKKIILQVLLYHPIFLISYLHAFVIALGKRNLGWEVITHDYKNN